MMILLASGVFFLSVITILGSPPLRHRTKVEMEERLALVSPLGDFHNLVPFRIVAPLPLGEDQLSIDLHFKGVFIALNSLHLCLWNLCQDRLCKLSCHLTVGLVFYSDTDRRRRCFRNPLPM